MDREVPLRAWLDRDVVQTLAARTFRHSIESPIAYLFALFLYLFIGFFFVPEFFSNNQGSIEGVGIIAQWVLFFGLNVLTIGLLSEELRSGTFEQLSTLPVRDWEIVLGKYLGFAFLCLLLVLGLAIYPLVISFMVDSPQGLDGGATFGVLAGIYLLMLMFGSIGLYASSLSKSQVVSFIIGVMLYCAFFFVGQLYFYFPGFLSQVADFLGISSHLNTLNRGVWDIRDLLYFGSMTFLFLYLTVQRLTTRRF